MMWPVWYEKRRKMELQLWGVGLLASVVGILLRMILFNVIGFIIMFSIMPLQEFRFRRMKKLEEDPLRCECGGHFVTPWELGFDAPADHLVCDNEHGDGKGIACEKWIVTPPDYPTSEGTASG